MNLIVPRGSRLRRLFFRWHSIITKKPWRFLGRVKGVIHVGANFGQERHLYNNYGLNVLWLEPIPEIFETLRLNIESFPRQRAVQALLSNEDGHHLRFHIASNEGASSSILSPKEHDHLWPDVSFERQILIMSQTLVSIVDLLGIDLDDYGALVIDAQGAESMILQGAASILHRFSYVQAEAANFEMYSGQADERELIALLDDHGFAVHTRHVFASASSGKACCDLIFRRVEVQ